MKLLTKDLEEKLKEYPLGSQDGKLGNSKVIAKFFNPTGVGTWYIIEGKLLENGDAEMFGYCNLGDDELAEFGTVMLSELESIQLPMGMTIERDLYIPKEIDLMQALKRDGYQVPDYIKDSYIEQINQKPEIYGHESIIICNPKADTNALKKEYKNYFKSISKNVEVDNIGLRKLAYEIKGLKEGYYLDFKYETDINENIYSIIKNSSIIKTSYHSLTGEVFYNIVNDKLEGSFDSSLSVRVGEGLKYRFTKGYYIEVEGSYHKIALGYNSHNGFYNLYSICDKLILMCNEAYNLKLPALNHWFLQRVDIAKCFDLGTNNNVCRYINNLSFCNYPRRKLKHFNDESIYLSGSSTTLKIYNKLAEFRKHDIKKLNVNGFDVLGFCHTIDGFVRFECEIKKHKLVKLYKNRYVRIRNLSYKDLEKIWSEEFMKLLKLFENDIKKVRKKEDVERRLKTYYKENLANRLYDFYMSIMCDGLKNVKNRTTKTTYYRNLKYLENAGIDLTQSINIDFEEQIIDFDPFSIKEVV